jgi:hypothetical protein
MGMNSPAETSGQLPREAADGEPSPFAPKRARDGRPQEKIVSLQLPAAPQLVPTASAGDGAAAPAQRGQRPSGPELLAEDAVFKRLLQNAPDPQPPAVKPERDAVGLALGMVARIVVAGCGVAAVILLLLGIIPSPLRPAPSATSDAAPSPTSDVTPVAPATPVETAATKGDLAIQVADAGGTAGVVVAPVSTAGVATADAGSSEPARVPTVPARAAQEGAGDQWALEPGEVERLVKRGEDYLAQGDIAAARLILGRAAEARNARAAFSLAATYDPSVLKQLHVVGFRPDTAQARAWYEKAAEYGSADASRRLAALPTPSQ